MPNQIKKDPSRTTTLRRRFVADMRRRFAKVSKLNTELIVQDDAFGLNTREPTSFNELGNHLVTTSDHSKAVKNVVPRQIWRFRTDTQKIQEYRKWLQQQINANILTPVGGISGQPWTSEYVESAYRKGVVRAFTDVHAKELAQSLQFYQGSRAEFLRSSFAAPEALSKIELVSTRAFTDLQGITATMSAQLSRHLANGLSQGLSPSEIARNMRKSIGTLTRTRAELIARTEVIAAHAEGQLDGFEKLGIEEVGIFAEWSTAGDERVCILCDELEGVVMKIKKARGLIPRHPNCRCAWIPADQLLKEKGQLWGAQKDKAIRDSIKAEAPKRVRVSRSPRDVLARSPWAGKRGVDKSKFSKKTPPLRKKVGSLRRRRGTLHKVWADAKLKVDQFGTRLGTKRALVNRLLGPTPIKVKEIVAKLNGVQTSTQVSFHLNKLLKKGLIKRGPQGYYVPSGTTAPVPAPVPAPTSTSVPATSGLKFKTADGYRRKIIDDVEKGMVQVEDSEIIKAAENTNERLHQEIMNIGSENVRLFKRLDTVEEGSDDYLRIKSQRSVLYKRQTQIQQQFWDNVDLIKSEKAKILVNIKTQRKLLAETNNLKGVMDDAVDFVNKKYKNGANDVLSWMPENALTKQEKFVLRQLRVEQLRRGGDTTVGAYSDFHIRIFGKKPDTFIHEFGHFIADFKRGYLKAATKFHKARTVGEKLKHIKGYGAEIKGKVDKYGRINRLAAYAGRSYPSYAVEAGLEIPSVGLEYIWKNPYNVAKKDPDWFNFIISNLKSIPEI